MGSRYPGCNPLTIFSRKSSCDYKICKTPFKKSCFSQKGFAAFLVIFQFPSFSCHIWSVFLLYIIIRELPLRRTAPNIHYLSSTGGLYERISHQPAGNHRIPHLPNPGTGKRKRRIKAYGRMDARHNLGYGKKATAKPLTAPAESGKFFLFSILFALFLSKEV